jgi:D-lactate dehydrogenase (cytochrome)
LLPAKALYDVYDLDTDAITLQLSRGFPDPRCGAAGMNQRQENKMNIAKPAVPPLPPELIARFRAIVGDKYAVTDAADIAPYVTEERDLFHGRSPLVLRPGSTAEVSAICKLATEQRIALVPQGGNTGLVGGQTPHNGEVVVSMRRMDRIRDIDTASNTMTCEAGVVLQVAQQRASEADRLFPLSLGAEGSCTIGGNLSTNAGGTTALAYGVAREMALGVEVVLADGRILNSLSKLKKDNTGYDLRNLFIGAEGTLGIITAATLKLFPKPRAVETAFVGLQSPAQALKLLSISQNEAAGSLTSFELLSDIAVDFSVRHGIDVRHPLAGKHPWYVLMELSSPRDDARDTLEAILAKGLDDGIVDDAVIATSLSQRSGFWKLRDEMSAAQKPEGGSIKHDISVPVAAVPDFLEQANAAVVKLIPGARPVPFGHLGDGNIHYNVSQPIGGNSADFLARWHEVNAVVFAIVLQMGGSISAEHGIGVLKRDELPEVKDKVAIELMRSIKAMLDPSGIMNPGKVL